MMRRILKVAAIAAVVIIVGVVALLAKVAYDARLHAEDQVMMQKSDDQLLGTHLMVPRDGDTDVDVNLYLLDDGETHPLAVNVHGGAFIAGDADALDTQSLRISNDWQVNVVTVNYTLATDGHTIEDGTQEVMDVVRYFSQHASEYGIDPNRIFVMGYSAGGYHAMASVLRLHEEGLDVRGQVICYGFLRDIPDLWEELSDEQRAGMPPALFVIADGDPIGEGSLAYEELLREAGVPTQVITYEGALHGFIEENNPEYEQLHSHASMSPEQEALAREAEGAIGSWITGNA